MLFGKKEDSSVEKFWQDYEKKTGEKVLAKSLCQYISGWAEYDGPLWGLAIATSGGFRFHHFPHEGWLSAMSRATLGGEAPKEKTFFIPRESISSTELIVEKNRLKKIFLPSKETIELQYRINGTETKIIVEIDRGAARIVEALKIQKQEI